MSDIHHEKLPSIGKQVAASQRPSFVRLLISLEPTVERATPSRVEKRAEVLDRLLSADSVLRGCPRSESKLLRDLIKTVGPLNFGCGVVCLHPPVQDLRAGFQFLNRIHHVCVSLICSGTRSPYSDETEREILPEKLNFVSG
jgi:hypothetical protein